MSKPKPTHEEIMTKWWYINGYWVQIIAYENGKYYYFDAIEDYLLDPFIEFRYKKDFDRYESADIPKEEDNDHE